MVKLLIFTILFSCTCFAQTEESPSVNLENVRFLSCVVFAAKKRDLEIRDEDYEDMFTRCTSNQKCPNGIPEFFFTCLDGVSYASMAHEYHASKDCGKIRDRSIVIMKGIHKSFPVYFDSSSSDSVQLSYVFPDSGIQDIPMEEFRKEWTGHFFSPEKSSELSAYWLYCSMLVGFVLILVAFWFPKMFVQKKIVPICLLAILVGTVGCDSQQINTVADSELNDKADAQIEAILPKKPGDLGFIEVQDKWDLGRINYDRKNDHTMVIPFKLNQRCKLVDLSKSCACIEWINDDLVGGLENDREYKLQLKVDFSRQAGSVRRTIRLLFEKPSGSKLEKDIEIDYRVWQPPSAGLPVLELLLKEGDDVASGILKFERLAALDDEPLEIDYSRSNFCGLSVGDIVLSPKREARGRIPINEKIVVPFSLSAINQGLQPNQSVIVSWKNVSKTHEAKVTLTKVHPLECENKKFLGVKRSGSTWNFESRCKAADSVTVGSLDSSFFEELVGKLENGKLKIQGRFPNKSGRFEERVSVFFNESSGLKPLVITFSGVILD